MDVILLTLNRFLFTGCILLILEHRHSSSSRRYQDKRPVYTIQLPDYIVQDSSDIRVVLKDSTRNHRPRVKKIEEELYEKPQQKIVYLPKNLIPQQKKKTKSARTFQHLDYATRARSPQTFDIEPQEIYEGKDQTRQDNTLTSNHEEFTTEIDQIQQDLHLRNILTLYHEKHMTSYHVHIIIQIHPIHIIKS